MSRSRSSRSRSSRSRSSSSSTYMVAVYSARNSSCFPARALALDVSGRAVPLHLLRIGATVLTGMESTSRVFMFSHAERIGLFDFIALRTARGTLTASPGHFVHTARGLMPAGDVHVGDALLAADGASTVVVSRENVREEGLYNPQTVDSNIVIDGFVVSTFTTAVSVPAAASL
eukprot:IDg21593t1